MGTLTQPSWATSPCLAGTKLQRFTAVRAASSSGWRPLLFWIWISPGLPLANTCTRNNTVPSQPRRWASDGYSGAGFFRYAALAEAGVTGAGDGAAAGAGGAGGAGVGGTGGGSTALGTGLGSGFGTGLGFGLSTGLGGAGLAASSSTTGGGGSTKGGGGGGTGGGGSTTGGAGWENSMVIGGISGGTIGNTGVGFWLTQ